MLNPLAKKLLRVYLARKLKSLERQEEALEAKEEDSDAEFLITKYAQVNSKGDVDFQIGGSLRSRDHFSPLS